MKECAKKFGIGVQERKLLLSGFAATEILLNEELARFYLKLGLVITRIHQVIEFCPREPFRDFANQVTTNRLEASRNKDRQIVGEIYKLIGNSAYGSQVGGN